MAICELPDNLVCTINLDLQEYGIIKGVFTDKADLYIEWDVDKEIPFKLEYDRFTGNLCFRSMNEDSTMGELRFACNIKGEDGLPGLPPRINSTTGNWEIWDNASNSWIDSDIKAKGEKGEKGDFSGDYNDLTNKPDFYSKDEVQELLTPLLTEIETLKEQIIELTNNKADKSELAPVALTGDYEDLTNKPNIPEFIDVTTEAEAQSTSTANPDAYVTYNDN